MPFKRLAFKHKRPKLEPGASFSSQRASDPTFPPGYRHHLSPANRDTLLEIFPDDLNWMLDNEDIRIGDILDEVLREIRAARERNTAGQILNSATSKRLSLMY